MFRNLLKNTNKKTVVFSAVLFVVFSVLIYLFPFSGDDWAWGSQIGLDRLANNFDNYNGRYAGNLLVLALTRSKALKIIVISVSLVCVCLFPKLFSKSKSFVPYVFGLLLFLLIPRQIFMQSIVWTSGYSNYVPPIILILLYFIIIKDIFEAQPPKYHWSFPILVGVIGFISSLFMENVTLYNVAVSALIITFAFFKFKKFYVTHIIHFLGSVLGAFLMFSNSAYSTIASGDDGYRSIALDDGLMETIIKQTDVIFKHFFRNNFILLLILSLLCLMIYFLYSKKSNNKKLKIVGLFVVLLNLFSCFIIFIKSEFVSRIFNMDATNSSTLTTLVCALVAIIYFVSALLTVIICVTSSSEKFKILLLLISVPILIAPLAVVKPVGPRCFSSPYLMLIAACVLIFVYIENSYKMTYKVKMCVSGALMVCCTAIFIFLFSIYSVIHTYDVKRNDYVKKQIEEGYDTVKVCKLPYSSYVWVENPAKAPWDYRYKLFYGIDEDIEFECLGFSQFDKWAVEFDKNGNIDK